MSHTIIITKPTAEKIYKYILIKEKKNKKHPQT
jgi:hypothetical protein